MSGNRAERLKMTRAMVTGAGIVTAVMLTALVPCHRTAERVAGYGQRAGRRGLMSRG